MRVVILDDEYYAIEGLKMKLQNIEGITVVATFEDGEQFLQEAGELDPDIVFLDVEMPKLDGFMVLERLLESEISPKIVFVTAHWEYAVEAFEINAMDYIVKPVTKERLQKTLMRLQEQLVPSNPQPSSLLIRCFHSFSIVANQQEICAGWKTKKSEELLAYLICEKGSYVSKEKLAEILWPDADRDKSMANLHVAFHYLKQHEKKMGISLPIESKRGLMRFVMDGVDLDIMMFDEYLIYAENPALPLEERIKWMEKAVALYLGGVLEDRYYHWETLSQHYEMKYEQLLHELIVYYGNSTSLKKLQFYKDCLSRLLNDITA